jgi:hypothetical protein
MKRRRREPDELDVRARERAANQALYALDPDLARELGYVPKSRAIRRCTPLQRLAIQGAPNPRAGTGSAPAGWFGVGGGFFCGAGLG